MNQYQELTSIRFPRTREDQRPVARKSLDEFDITIQRYPYLPTIVGSQTNEFLLCLFYNDIKQAKELLFHMKDSVVECLIASNVFNTASQINGSRNYEKRKEYEDQAEKFSRYAAELIDELALDSQKKNFMESPANAFWKLTPRHLIKRNNCKSIFSSRVVHEACSELWFHDFEKDDEYIHSRLILTTVLFPLAPLLILLNLIPFRKELKWSGKIKSFYQAPIVVFYNNYLFSIWCLMIFGYVLLAGYYPLNIYGERRGTSTNLKITRSEILLHFWMWGIIFEEILECAQARLLHGSFKDYFRQKWNVLDCVAILCYLIGFFTRFKVSEPVFMTSKIFVAIDLIFWCLRILHLFSAYQNLGWNLILIFRMMKDLVFFFSVIIIILFGFSISVTALQSTNKEVTWSYDAVGRLINATVVNDGAGSYGYELYDWVLIKQLFDWGITKAFGNADIPERADNGYFIVSWILTVIFVFISVILLWNALIALFSVTIDDVRQQSKLLWRYHRFMLISEYCDKSELPDALKRSLVPPPLNIAWYLVLIIYRCFVASDNCQRNQPRHPQDGQTGNQDDEKMTTKIRDYWIRVEEFEARQAFFRLYLPQFRDTPQTDQMIQITALAAIQFERQMITLSTS
ncbi:unnamed protein product, partial [Didymodactylos carnosus]